MDDAAFVRGIERVGDLASDWNRVIDRQRATLDPVGQCLAVDEFHDEKRRAVDVDDVVESGDVGMIERGEGFGFALKPGEAIGISGHRIGQHLDRDLALQPRITRPKHAAHTAFTDEGGELYAPIRMPGAIFMECNHNLGPAKAGPHVRLSERQIEMRSLSPSCPPAA